MLRPAFALYAALLALPGAARAGCPTAVVKTVATTGYYGTGHATYVTPYVANVVTLAAPLAVVTTYPAVVVPAVPTVAAPAAAPVGESEEVRALKAKVEALERAKLEADIEARVRERILRELQQQKKPGE